MDSAPFALGASADKCLIDFDWILSANRVTFRAHPASAELVQNLEGGLVAQSQLSLKLHCRHARRYRAVDRTGDTVNFLLTAKRDLAAARRFLVRAINLHDVPATITIDRGGANTAAIKSVKTAACVDILLRQSKYLYNIVRHGHRAIKWTTQTVLGFIHLKCSNTYRWHRDDAHDSQGDRDCPVGEAASSANQFYGLAP